MRQDYRPAAAASMHAGEQHDAQCGQQGHDDGEAAVWNHEHGLILL
jgi:hypothetical protein